MSTAIRLSEIGPADIAAARERLPRAFARPALERWGFRALTLLAAGYVLYLHWLFDLTPQRLLAGLDKAWIILRLMVDWSRFAEWNHAEIFGAMAETVAMAFLASMLSAAVALPLGFLGARNVIPSRMFRFFTRRCFDVLRGVDQVIWALVFVRAVGLGPVAGILGLFVHHTGVLAKLYAEAIETAERGPVDGVRATGASGVAVLRFGVLPQVLPVMISQALYEFESLTRSATILGIVGAGGIGLQLSERILIRAWDEVAYIIVLILVAVGLIDTLSKAIRVRLIRGGGRA